MRHIIRFKLKKHAKKMVYLFVSQILFITLLSSNIVAVTDSWPMLNHDSANTRVSSGTGPETNQTFLETTLINQINQPKQGSYLTGLAPIVADSRLAFQICRYASPNEIYYINALTGIVDWKKTFSNVSSASYYSIAKAGEKLFVPHNEELVCLNTSDGSQRWKVTTDGCGTPIISDDKLYYQDWGGVHCLSLNGVELWNYPMYNYSNLIPAVANGKVYGAAITNDAAVFVFCLDASTGAPIWNITLKGYYPNGLVGPAVGNGKVFLTTDAYLFCLNATGDGAGSTTLHWVLSANIINYYMSWTYSPPLAVSGSKLYYSGFSSEGYAAVFCLNTDNNGAEIWRYDLVDDWGDYLSGPTVADGKIYVAGRTSVYCLEDNGDGTVSLLWSYQRSSTYPDKDIFLNPIVAEGKVWVCCYSFVQETYYNYVWSFSIYGFGQQTNLPPATPGKPSGQSNGIINEAYAFTTVTTDSNRDTVAYVFDWGDGTFSDWTPYAFSGTPQIISHTWMVSGSYEVKVKAKDSKGAESGWSEPLHVSISDQSSEQLHISVTPSTVLENEQFIITILANGLPVDHASVEFNENIYTTDITGIVTLTAPQVDKSTEYQITASKEGYFSVHTTLIVLQKPTTVSQGWIFGVVTDMNGDLIRSASVCISLSNGGTNILRECMFTDEQGRYYKAVTPGTYTVDASKQGYATNTKETIEIHENEAVEANFILDKELTTANKEIIEYAIQYGIDEGIVGVEITIPEKEPGITLYNDQLTIIPAPTQQGTFQFTIAGPDGTHGTVVALRIENPEKLFTSDIKNLKDLSVIYDGQPITMMTNFGDILNPAGTEPRWAGFVTEQGIYILVYAPHFSEHTIVISSVVDAFSGIIAILTYVFVSVILLGIFLSPMITNVIRRRRSFRK